MSCDDGAAAEQAVATCSLGHTKIGLLLGPRDHVPSQRKLEAAQRTATAAGHPIATDRIAHSLYSLEAAQASAGRLIRAGATGIVCASDPMALGAIRAVRRAGLNVPADVSVIGFDDSALMSAVDPPLTTVRQPIDAMGRLVIELLVAQIAGNPVAHDEMLFEPELVVRASTGPVSTSVVLATRPHRAFERVCQSVVKFLHSFVVSVTLRPATATHAGRRRAARHS